jgi:hypothetical protein
MQVRNVTEIGKSEEDKYEVETMGLEGSWMVGVGLSLAFEILWGREVKQICSAGWTGWCSYTS